MTRKSITISLFEDDLKIANKKMRALRKLGHRMNFSRLVRIALHRLDTENISPPNEGLG